MCPSACGLCGGCGRAVSNWIFSILKCGFCVRLGFWRGGRGGSGVAGEVVNGLCCERDGC